MKKMMVLVLGLAISLCLAQTHSLEIHASIDGEAGYCDSLLSLVGAVPGAGIHDIPDGDTINLTIDTTLIEVSTGARDSCYGWSATGSPCPTTDTCFGEGTLISFLMTEDTRFTWNFKRQFTFEVTCSHPGYDSPEPPYGVHWFDRGDTITASVVTSAVDSSDSLLGIIYNCIGWRGTGCVPATGPTPYVPPYHICAITCTTSGTLEWLWDTVATGIDEESIFPENISISAYPNPFNSSVTILLAAGGVGASDARSGQVGIEIFDISGRLVADLPVTNCGIPQFVPTPVIWQPEKSVGSGIYLIRAKIGDGEITKRIVYLK